MRDKILKPTKACLGVNKIQGIDVIHVLVPTVLGDMDLRIMVRHLERKSPPYLYCPSTKTLLASYADYRKQLLLTMHLTVTFLLIAAVFVHDTGK